MIDLFQWGRARATDPDTAKAAARTVNAAKLERAVLNHLRENGPSTVPEIALGTGINKESVNPRMRPLVEKGFILDSGKRRKAKVFSTCPDCGCQHDSRETRPCIVWCIDNGNT